MSFVTKSVCAGGKSGAGNAAAGSVHGGFAAVVYAAAGGINARPYAGTPHC